MYRSIFVAPILMSLAALPSHQQGPSRGEAFTVGFSNPMPETPQGGNGALAWDIGVGDNDWNDHDRFPASGRREYYAATARLVARRNAHRFLQRSAAGYLGCGVRRPGRPATDVQRRASGVVSPRDEDCLHQRCFRSLRDRIRTGPTRRACTLGSTIRRPGHRTEARSPSPAGAVRTATSTSTTSPRNPSASSRSARMPTSSSYRGRPTARKSPTREASPASSTSSSATPETRSRSTREPLPGLPCGPPTVRRSRSRSLGPGAATTSSPSTRTGPI